MDMGERGIQSKEVGGGAQDEVVEDLEEGQNRILSG